MTAYIYRTTRKSIKVEGIGNVNIAVYAYKPYGGMDLDGNNDRMYSKYVSRTVTAWERANERPEYITKGSDDGKPEEGARVYKSSSICFGDDSMDNGTRDIGVLKKVGRKWTVRDEEPEK